MKNLKLSIEKRFLKRQTCVLKSYGNFRREGKFRSLCSMNSSVLTKLIVCKICTDPFIAGKIQRPSKNYLLKTAAMPPFAHKDKLS